MGLVLKDGKEYVSPTGIPCPQAYLSIIGFEAIDRINQRTGGIRVGVFYSKDAFLKKKPPVEEWTYPGAETSEDYIVFFASIPDRPTLGEATIKRAYEYLMTKAEYFPHFNLNDWESDEIQQEQVGDPTS